MVKRRVLVTGGNGYIGSRLSLHLAQGGYAVTPLCFPSAPNDTQWTSLMESVVVGDIRDGQLIERLAGQGFDVVVHLVSLDHHQSAGDPSFVASVNITPTWSLLDAFSKAGLCKFVYFSTMQVYGVLPAINVTENYIPQTSNAYALTHHLGEELCRHYNRNSGTQCRVVRLSNSYGAPIFMENNCWWLVINDLCRMAIKDKRIALLSDGSPRRDFIHGWDVCRAVESIISTDSPYDTYHVSSGITLTLMEIAHRVRDIYVERYGLSLEITAPVSVQRDSDDNGRYTIDNSRLVSIGFSPQWDLDKGINDLFDFLEHNE